MFFIIESFCFSACHLIDFITFYVVKNFISQYKPIFFLQQTSPYVAYKRKYVIVDLIKSQ